MNIKDLKDNYKDFICSNYSLIKNHNISELEIMKKYGVYIICDNDNNVIYIGKGGTIRQDGTMKDQNISKRLKNIRDKQTANNFFKNVMTDNGFDSLTVVCIETYPKKLPGFVEADLIQRFYDNEHKLPLLNKSF